MITSPVTNNAPFLVNGSLVAVNEREAPSDFAFEYLVGVWENLGTATVTNGTLTVTLSDAANDTVVADMYDSNGNKVTLGTVTSPDISGNWNLTVTLLPGTYTLYAQAEDNFGDLSDPVMTTLQVN